MKEAEGGIIITVIYHSQYTRYTIPTNDQQAYIIYLLVNYCMPTLLKRKSSSLIRVEMKKMEEEESFLNALGYQLEPFCCSYSILFKDNFMLLLLIYHRQKLAETLTCKENRLFLEAFGYHLEGDSVANVIKKLEQEYGLYRELRQVWQRRDPHLEYPHEVGIILGYPVNDVKGFIDNKGADYKLCGYWKVYQDADSALKIFDSYRQIRENSIRLVLEGKKLQDLIHIIH